MTSIQDSSDISTREIISLNEPDATPTSPNFSIPINSNTTNVFQSPVPSFAKLSSTAFTSPISNDEETTVLGLSSVTPPQSLRKSFSVDSFTQYNRDGSRSVSSDPPELSRPFNPPGARQDKKHWSGRFRGESLSSVVHHEPSNSVDSDLDRYDPFAISPLERFRPLKNQDSIRNVVRGGDLPLPSRAANSNSSSRLASNASTSSLQSTPRRGTLSLAISSGRMRSGSLGYNPPSISKRMTVSPSVPPIRTSISHTNIVLAVIGTAGCGKSTVVRKGLSGYGLVDLTLPSDSLTPSGQPRFVRRVCSVNLDSSPGAVSTTLAVEVIETTDDGLLNWPEDLPPIDGVIICYDSSDKRSYQPVESLLDVCSSMILPIMVLGCKADLEHEVDPENALEMLKQYDTGLIEVSTTSDGKEKMKLSFGYMLKAILRQRGPDPILENRNPASPDSLYKAPSWSTPSSSPSIPSPSIATSYINTTIPKIMDSLDSSLSSPPIDTPITEAGVNEIDIAKSQIDAQDSNVVESEDPQPELPDDGTRRVLEHQTNGMQRDPRPAQWADLETLLDKLLFLAISGEDPNFTTHFLLVYRRFATPRSVLLAMQKRMRQLDNPCGDPMFACFAQMRICQLLETWIRDYPHDFAVKGTAGALNALIKSVISKTHLLHYGSEFLPFLEQLPSLVDQDSAWALKADVLDDETDDDDDEETKVDETESIQTGVSSHTSSSVAVIPARERKSSLPLSKTMLPTSQPSLAAQNGYDQSPKHHIKDLVRLAQEVLNTDSDEMAQEITRQGAKRFLEIKPRDWLYFTFYSGKKVDTEPITAFNTMSNHLADWVVSLILCHERPRQRARQIEKFVEIAQKLRQMNNYSALRAFVAGINNANDDTTTEQFKARSPDAAKNLKSWDVLLQQIGSHRAYRLALRNSKGACIPAMEVHISDLIKAQEGNDDTNSSYPSKIHWGKFNMMGRFITSTLQCQSQCRNSNDYDFPERPGIAELFVKKPVMNIEMQKSRLKSEEFDYDDITSIPTPKDIAGLRKLFFW